MPLNFEQLLGFKIPPDLDLSEFFCHYVVTVEYTASGLVRKCFEKDSYSEPVPVGTLDQLLAITPLASARRLEREIKKNQKKTDLRVQSAGPLSTSVPAGKILQRIILLMKKESARELVPLEKELFLLLQREVKHYISDTLKGRDVGLTWFAERARTCHNVDALSIIQFFFPRRIEKRLWLTKKEWEDPIKKNRIPETLLRNFRATGEWQRIPILYERSIMSKGLTSMQGKMQLKKELRTMGAPQNIDYYYNVLKWAMSLKPAKNEVESVKVPETSKESELPEATEKTPFIPKEKKKKENRPPSGVEELKNQRKEKVWSIVSRSLYGKIKDLARLAQGHLKEAYPPIRVELKRSERSKKSREKYLKLVDALFEIRPMPIAGQARKGGPLLQTYSFITNSPLPKTAREIALHSFLMQLTDPFFVDRFKDLEKITPRVTIDDMRKFAPYDEVMGD